MKKLNLYTAIFLTVIFASSCEKFLNQQPISNIGEDSFNLNEKDLETSLTGCYNGLQGALHAEWAVTELRSDNTRIYCRVSSTAIFEQIKQLDLANTTSMNTLVEEYWKSTYVNIDRCNRVIRDINVVTDQEKKSRFLAEAKFIRAYHYFNLVRLWGGIFLVTEPITSEEARYKQRSNVEDVYQLIIDDLKEIVDNSMLPESYPAEDLGRVTLLAAKALLAKVYVTKYSSVSNEYSTAKDMLKEIIDYYGNPVSASQLVSFDKIFDVTNEMNREIIFAVRYKSGNLGIGSPFANEFSPSLSGSAVVNGGGKSYNYPSTDIINAFKEEDGDIRKDISLAEKYMSEQGDWVEDDNIFQCRFVKKYLTPIETVNDGDADWPVIRFADVLLLYSEIVNELQGPTSETVNYLNMIRARAGLPALTSIQTSDSYNFRKAIRKERRLELAFENQRFFDLQRWGTLVDVLNNQYKDELIYNQLPNGYKPSIVQWQTFLPIPLIVTTINPEIPQNYGY